ncbi:XdhC family protein [Amycolatopsis sp. NPDC023774]|uniref:XdhC family protein n=1 Tax=Amycolatopsis sp. NPDC023774 TaxID=3155015 RepID=UPI0033EBD89F
MTDSADSWDVLAQAGELARRGEAFALATVVWRQGPSSGKQGCRAIITAEGELRGWIGGACAEPAVIREARQSLVEGTPRLLLLGSPEQFGAAVPAGMTVVPISCQSEGALQVYIEPMLPVPHLVVVGRSPMAHTLVELAGSLGWHARLAEHTELDGVTERSFVVVATQGHHDEESVERALAARPAYVGLVGSRRRGASVLGYLADRGVDTDELDRVQVPAGLDLGRVSHREIAVSILAELVRIRAAREVPSGPPEPAAAPDAAEPVDPVCGMTVEAGDPVAFEGHEYSFCCAGCRAAFLRDPGAYAKKESRC